MWNSLPANKLKSTVLFIVTLFGGFSAFSQKAIDFGLGATISTGLQDEWAIHLKSQYHFHTKWNTYGEYNLFFMLLEHHLMIIQVRDIVFIQ